MKLQRASLKQQALTIIRQGLVSGEIKAGQTYSAAALAQQLGTSTGPVREAMLALVEQGIVRPVPNVGFEVVRLTDQDLDEIYELRLMLEVPAMRAIATEQVNLVDARVHATACARAAEAHNVNAFLAADRDFHLELLTHAGNQRLVRFVATLRDQTRLYGLAGLAHQGQLVDFANEHFELLDAIEAGDAELASQLMNDHLSHVRRDWAAPDQAGGGNESAEPSAHAHILNAALVPAPTT